MSKSQQPNLCLIGGSGRSGTSILRKIFGEHPAVAKVPEWRGNIDPDSILDFYISFTHCWSPHYFDLKLRRLNAHLKSLESSTLVGKGMTFLFHKLGYKPPPVFPRKLSLAYANVEIGRFAPNFGQLRTKLINDLTDFSFRGQWIGSQFGHAPELQYASPRTREELAETFNCFYCSVILDILKAQDAEHYVEDNTWNYIWFNYLLELYPSAKLVHIYRDPRDVVASYLKQRWAPDDVAQAATMYRDLMGRWETIKKDVPAQNFIEVSLDELVTDSHATISKIAEFWEIPWHDNLMTIDLSRSNKGRWKKDLDSKQQVILNDALGDVVERYGGS